MGNGFCSLIGFYEVSGLSGDKAIIEIYVYWLIGFYLALISLSLGKPHLNSPAGDRSVSLEL